MFLEKASVTDSRMNSTPGKNSRERKDEKRKEILIGRNVYLEVIHLNPLQLPLRRELKS